MPFWAMKKFSFQVSLQGVMMGKRNIKRCTPVSGAEDVGSGIGDVEGLGGGAAVVGIGGIAVNAVEVEGVVDGHDLGPGLPREVRINPQTIKHDRTLPALVVRRSSAL